MVYFNPGQLLVAGIFLVMGICILFYELQIP